MGITNEIPDSPPCASGGSRTEPPDWPSFMSFVSPRKECPLPFAERQRFDCVAAARPTNGPTSNAASPSANPM
jgi:hypothetical protein